MKPTETLGIATVEIGMCSLAFIQCHNAKSQKNYGEAASWGLILAGFALLSSVHIDSLLK